MSAAFTQGPWRVCHHDGEVGVDCEREPDRWVAMVGQSGCEIPEANAHLIAAAPDLYEAIAALVDDPLYGLRIGWRGNGPTAANDLYCELCGAFAPSADEIAHDTGCPVSRATAALAKARGEQ